MESKIVSKVFKVSTSREHLVALVSTTALLHRGQPSFGDLAWTGSLLYCLLPD